METKRRFKPTLLCGLVVAMTATPSCLKVNKDLPGVIALPGETVPHSLKRGETAEFDGWLLPTPLFNEVLPCMRDRLEHPDREAYPAIDDGWEANGK